MTPRKILALGWLVFFLYAYPGYMTVDSLDMLIDARTGDYTDWHSPVMSAVWNIVNIPLTGGPGMLVVQSGGVLLGGYVLLRRALSDRAAAIAAASILVFPPVMASLAVISEDALLASALVGAAALFTYERRWVRIAGVLCIVVACGMREGAWLVALPIALGFVWRADRWRYPIALGAWAAAALLAFGLDHLLVDRHTQLREAQLALADVRGMAAYTDAQNAPASIPQDPAGRGALIEARKELRAADPHAYATARFEHTKRLLSRSKNAVYMKDNVSLHFKIVAGHAGRPSAFQKILRFFVRAIGKTPLFAPIVYLALAIVLVVLARDRISRALAATGIALTLALSITTWDVQFRYVTTLVVATLIALVLVVKQRTASASHE